MPESVPSAYIKFTTTQVSNPSVQSAILVFTRKRLPHNTILPCTSNTLLALYLFALSWFATTPPQSVSPGGPSQYIPLPLSQRNRIQPPGHHHHRSGPSSGGTLISGSGVEGIQGGLPREFFDWYEGQLGRNVLICRRRV
jgi:hypothetical protein